MRGKFIDFEDVPSNFVLERYDACFSWTLETWSMNLANRRALKDNPLDESPLEESPRESLFARIHHRLAERTFDEPELTWLFAKDGRMGLKNEFGGVDPDRVRDISCLEYLRARELFRDDGFKGYTDAYDLAARAQHPYIASNWNPDASEECWDAKQTLDSTPEWIMFRDANSDMTRLSHLAIASVDLSASDAELEKDFRAWLAKARQSRIVESHADMFTAQDMAGWANMRVLAYIDLSSWAEIRGFKIPLPVMGRVLFPNEFNISLEDRVRKVVARDAELLMRPQVIRAMHAQSLKAERKT